MRKVKNIQCHRPHIQFKASHGQKVKFLILNMIHSKKQFFHPFRLDYFILS